MKGLRRATSPWPRRTGTRRSMRRRLPGTWMPCACCWTTAPTSRPRSRSALALQMLFFFLRAASFFALLVVASSGPTLDAWQLWLGRGDHAGDNIARRGRGFEAASATGCERSGSQQLCLGSRLPTDYVLGRPPPRPASAKPRMSTSQGGYTALVVAAGAGAVGVMNLLLDRGAQVDTKIDVSRGGAIPRALPSHRGSHATRGADLTSTVLSGGGERWRRSHTHTQGGGGAFGYKCKRLGCCRGGRPRGRGGA